MNGRWREGGKVEGRRDDEQREGWRERWVEGGMREEEEGTECVVGERTRDRCMDRVGVGGQVERRR